MLAFVSDLHLRDTDRHTLAPGEMRAFLEHELLTLARTATAKTIRFVLLGDIFDLNRSYSWNRVKVAPWSTHAAMYPTLETSQELEAAVLEILHGIESRNADTLSVLREFAAGSFYTAQGEPDIATSLEFIPGNHDRLSDFSPRIRAEVRGLLGLVGDPQEPFRWERDYAPDYPVYAYHGHIIDPPNYGGGSTRFRPDGKDFYNDPNFGDVVTVALAARIPVLYREQLSRLDPRSELPDSVDNLVAALERVDLVRPQSRATDWLAASRVTGTPKLREAMRVTLARSVTDIARNRFVRWWLLNRRGPRGKLEYLVAVVIGWLGLAFLSWGGVQRVYRALLSGKRSERDYRDEIGGLVWTDLQKRGDNCGGPIRSSYCVSGHTHLATSVVLDVTAETAADRTYFNSGTWLESLEPAIAEGFGGWRLSTYVAFYNAEEMHHLGRPPELGSFEMWSGYLVKRDPSAPGPSPTWW